MNKEQEKPNYIEESVERLLRLKSLGNILTSQNILEDEDIDEVLEIWNNMLKVEKGIPVDLSDLIDIIDRFKRGFYSDLPKFIHSSDDRLRLVKSPLLLQSYPNTSDATDLEIEKLERIISLHGIDNIIKCKYFLTILRNPTLAEWLGGNTDKIFENYLKISSQSPEIIYMSESQLDSDKALFDIDFRTALRLNRDKKLSFSDISLLTQSSAEKIIELPNFEAPLTIDKMPQYLSAMRQVNEILDIESGVQYKTQALKWAIYTGQLQYSEDLSDKQIEDAIENYSRMLWGKVMLPPEEYLNILNNEYLYPFRSTVGFEMEFKPKTNDVKLALKLLDSIGIKQGDGGDGYVEFSPGPFCDPITQLSMLTVSLDYLNENHIAQGIHYNFGTRYALFNYYPVRLFHGTGRCLQPVFSSSMHNAEKNLLRYGLNYSDNGGLMYNLEQTVAESSLVEEYQLQEQYLETKEFHLLTFHEAIIDWQEKYWVYTSLKPIQILQGRILNRFYDRTKDESRINYTFLADRISNLDNLYVQELARVALKYLKILELGYKEFSYYEILTKTADMTIAKKFYGEIKAVIADESARYKGIEGTVTHKKTFEGIEFNNVVEFSRWVSHNWAMEAIGVYLNAKKDLGIK